MVNNSVGTNMFRNFWVSTPEQGLFDALADGDKSCAFFVSGVLDMLKKLGGVHGTVASTEKDLLESGWVLASGDMQEGDVLVWEEAEYEEGRMRHIGFYVGDDSAVSTSWKTKTIAKHHVTFDGTRKIEKIYRHASW